MAGVVIDRLGVQLLVGEVWTGGEGGVMGAGVGGGVGICVIEGDVFVRGLYSVLMDEGVLSGLDGDSLVDGGSLGVELLLR